MARVVDRKKYIASKNPPLTPAQLNGKKKATFTVKHVDTALIGNAAEGPRDAIKVIFSEFPDHAFWPNRASAEAMFEDFGDDLDDWTGKKVALVVQSGTNPRTGETTDTLWVADAVPAE